MDNDARGLLFFILGFTSIWLVFDNFFGKKYVSNLAALLTPQLGGLTPPPLNDPNPAGQSAAAAKKKVDSDPKLNQQEKDFLKKNIDKFFNSGPGLS